MNASAAEPALPTARPSRVLQAIAQMAAIGIIGPVIISVLATLLGLGIGLIPVFGVGLIILAGFAYSVLGIGRLETARIEGLYRFGTPVPPLRSSGRTGFGGFLRTVWLQATDPTSWRGVANLAVASALGWITIVLASVLVSGVAMAFATLYAVDDTETVRMSRLGIEVPIEWSIATGIITAIAAAAALYGIGVLHGVIARAIIVPSREAQLAEQARSAGAQRTGAVRAAEVERNRIERDLHDGVQPRLVSVGMTLGLAQQKLDTDPDEARALIAEAHTSTKAAITELRQLARGIHASVLDDRGLDAALSALAARSVIPVQPDVRLEHRCRRETEAAAYFAIAEALTNAAKHSRATEVRVLVRYREPDLLWARVEDNGIGGAVAVPGGGLDGITNRVLAAGGSTRIDSPTGGPTTVEVSIPCAS